jgi:hypothetical protein
MDYSAAIVKSGVSMIPIFGGPATELFGAVTSAVLGRRRDEWFEQLRLRVNDLTHVVEGLNWEGLTNNEAFTSAVLQAATAALKTSATDKREALRNAVLNVAAGTAPDEDTQSMFLALVDALTPMHLRLLWLVREGSAVPIADAPACLKGNHSHQAIRELLDRGLVETTNKAERQFLLTGQDGIYRFSVKVSQAGEEFIRFLTAPDVLTR